MKIKYKKLTKKQFDNVCKIIDVDKHINSVYNFINYGIIVIPKNNK